MVHNGKTPTLTAVAALETYRASHGPVILLTNAPRLAGDIRAQFDRIGVSHKCYDAIVTSGEATRADLAARASGVPSLPIFNLGPDRDKATYEGLPVSLVSPEEAQLVLCTGLFNDEVEGPDDYTALLERFAIRGLPFLCANPDVTVRRGNDILYCAGAIARRYEEMGGAVTYFGKPYGPIFENAQAVARKLGAARRPLVIGDGLATDIRGANLAGLDALFIVGGLAGAELGELPADEAKRLLNELFVSHHVHARARLDELRW